MVLIVLKYNCKQDFVILCYKKYKVYCWFIVCKRIYFDNRLIRFIGFIGLFLNVF